MNQEFPSLDVKLNLKKKRLHFLKRWESAFAGYMFILPWLIGVVFLVMWPFFQSLYLSFTKYNLLSAPKWVGWQNYDKIFMSDDLFVQSLKVAIYYVLFSVPLKLILALLIAMLLNKKIKGMSFYRTMIYFPSLIGTSMAVSILWKNIFGADGLINQLLGVIGIAGTTWLTNPATALTTLGLLEVWQYGSTMIIFLAGLKQVSRELYEAASVDGASKTRQFFKITLPMLSPVILFNLVMQIIGSFQTFTQAFMITKGGPLNTTYMYAMYLYERAFTRLEMGYASALAWIMLIVIGIITVCIFSSARYWVHYETEAGGKK